MTAMWIELDRGRLFADAQGDPSGAPVAVLVHGAGSDHRVWSRQAEGLAARGWRVLAVDLPGHGRSGGAAPDSIPALADALLALLDAAGIGPARLAGHSMGALVALEFAARAPRRVEALTLIGVAARMPVHPDLLAAARADLPRAASMIASWGHGAAAGEAAEATRRLLCDSPPGTLAAGLTACDGYDATAVAPCLRVPTTLVLGEADKMSPARAGCALAALIPGAGTKILPGAGHMLMAERPEAVLEALLDQA